MSEKSVREMSPREQKRHSLSAKVFKTALGSAFVLGMVALLLGLSMYIWSTVNQYIAESFGLARSTAAVIDRAVNPNALAGEVMVIYHGLTDEQRRSAGTEACRRLFSGIDAREDYQTLSKVLGVFRDASEVQEIYLGCYDRETGALVYICNPNSPTEWRPEDWEPVEKREIDRFYGWDGEGKLYDISRTRQYGWLCTSGVPLRDEAGEIACFVLCDITLGDVARSVRSFLIQYACVMLVAVNLLGWLLTRRMRRALVKPISEIAGAAKTYVSDRRAGAPNTDHFTRLSIRTGDELENLSLVMAEMERSLTEYEDNLTRVTAEKERIGTELTLATRIQADMLPGIFPPYPERTEFDIYATMDPAKEVGGDFYDFFLIDDDHLALVMADVSGKGVPAALFMMSSKILLANTAMQGKSPREVLEIANAAICTGNREQMFVTVWLGILEISTGRVVAANAGHEYPVIRQPDGRFELFRDPHGFVVGGMEGVRYRDYELQLRPGAALFVYTDGVTEATRADGGLFGTRRRLDALNADPGADAQALLKNMRRSVDAFTGDAPQFDDMTMLCVIYKGTEAQGGKAG